MRKRLIGALCVVFFVAVTAFSAGPQQPGAGGSYTPSCQECEITEYGWAECYADVPNGAWADCQGGEICYWNGYWWECEPYCGRSRCLYV